MLAFDPLCHRIYGAASLGVVGAICPYLDRPIVARRRHAIAAVLTDNADLAGIGA